MYLAQGEQSNSLRQGDILKNLQVLGTIDYHQVTSPSGLPGMARREPQSWSVTATPKFRDCMVLTHCCDLDRENENKVTSIILAPLRDVHTATKPEKVDELIQSNDITQPGVKASFLKYFYVDREAKLMARNGAIVDFSKCFSIRNKAYDYLLERKLLQLTDTVRLSMSLKLALYFHREDTVAA